jgi:predicted transcriptional regulator
MEYKRMTEKTKKEPKGRTTAITVRLDPKILRGLHDIAERFGIAPSTVAGMAIGEYVAKTESTLATQGRMAELMAEQMAKVIGGPMAALLEGKTPDELKEMFKDD